ncbi:hypothetical protein [Rhizorhabdus sp.]|uniref:hypothetical protein n=1 Tax=Rhizorhabdus sp. TaxID=1968843 RepID=UPI0035AE0443
MSKNPLLDWKHADARRRIHIRAVADGATFSLGATGRPHHTPSLGEAFDQAIAANGYEDAVIIYEGRGA